MRKSNILYFNLVGTLLSFYSGNVLSQRQIDPEIKSMIQHVIANVYMPMANNTPLSLAIVQGDGKLLYTTGFGMANREKNIPIGNKTQFMTGSVSKNFAATFTVKTLHEAFPEMGEAVLDTPIRKLMPQVNFTLIDRYRSEQTTFRDLLAHRVGINPNDLMANAGKFATTQEMLYRTRYSEQVLPFRSSLSYDGQMITMACELAATLVNKPFNEAFDDFMFELGMFNTTYMREEDDMMEMPWRAWPYYIEDNEYYPLNAELMKRIVVTNPAGGLFTTSDDMTRYMRLYLNKGKLDGRQIIPEEVMSWILKPANTFPGYLNFKQSEDDILLASFYGYGLGMMLGTYDGWEYLLHGGNAPPYSNLISMYPALDLGVFSSMNAGPFNYAVAFIFLHAAIFEILNGNFKAVEKALQLHKQMEIKENKRMETEQLEQLNFIQGIKDKAMHKDQVEVIGYYGSGGLGDLEIIERFNEELNQNQLYLNYSIWYTGWLERTEDENIYEIQWDTDVVQDRYVRGPASYLTDLVIVEEDRLLLVGTMGFSGWFHRGLRSDLLPEIPWSPDSCGPESFRE